MGYFLFVDCDHRLHFFDSALVFDLDLRQRFAVLGYFVVLQLNIGGFLCVFSLKEEIVVLEFFKDVGLRAFDFVDFDGVLGLFLVEGLQQFPHDLSDLGLDFVPLKLSDFECLFLALLVFAHYLLRRNLVI